MEPRYRPIADYALIGDCHTAALVARDGSIDWFCPGRFDGPAVFCRLLDADKGGYLRTAPPGHFQAHRQYRGATNVLETQFSTSSGRLRATDLMPIHKRTSDHQGYDVGASHRLLRRLECLEGDVELLLEFKPTFDYARASTQLEIRDRAGVVAYAGDQCLTLAARDAEFHSDGRGRVTASVRLEAGDVYWVALTYAQDPDRADEALAPVHPEAQLERTLRYWQDWAGKCTYQGRYRDLVQRSALALKLLTYEPTGAVVAAPTTSLPERFGGDRNWDYRFTWLRDSSLILYALLTVGYGDEAADFTHWLERTIGSDPTRRPQIMYGIDGRTDLHEEVLDQLAGYAGSHPVRIGNAAAGQRQLDIYGEVLRAAALHYQQGSEAPHEGQPATARRGQRPTDSAWRVLRELTDCAAADWNECGSGIWEVRSGPHQFLYGKLMCWAALDCALRMAHTFQLQADLERWQRTRDEVRSTILAHGYNTRIGAFTQSFDSETLDASALIIPRIGFLPANDHRVRSTVERIQQHLTENGLVYRYRTPDGLAGGEGTFTLCTFWLADALALGGRLDEARELFEHIAGYANDVGLLAEEIDPGTREQLGNFPQGFSHLALISAGVDIAKVAEHGSEQRSENEGERADRAAT